MTGFAFASTNLVAPAKIIKKYFDGSRLGELAALPSKQELIAGILGSLDSPVSGIVGSIAAVMRDLVSVVDEVSKKKVA